MNNNNSTAAISVQESWASNLSDYILLRRQQTHLAYQATQSNQAIAAPITRQADRQSSKSLFNAVLIMLAAYLEEGHTVLTMTAHNHEIPTQGNIHGETVTLYTWQQQLLQRLAAPIISLLEIPVITEQANTTTQISIDKPLANEPSLFVVLDYLLTHQDKLWTSLAISHHEKQILLTRLKVLTALYQLLKNTDMSDFVRRIAKEDLFADSQTTTCADDKDSKAKNSLSKINQPIIYQKTSTKKSNKVITSVTFWLHRAWQAEFNLAKNINDILSQQITPLPIIVPDTLNPEQVAAINIANDNAFSIITGGQGTGKTYTVAQLVIALQQATTDSSSASDRIRFSTDSASLALAAPTGKAAQRMQESLQAALDAANVELQLQEAKTIHRLLGIGRTGRPRYDASNPLGEDIIIVDEASMLGVELANYLVNAVKSGARLILLGDANQLAAVDAGAVLADLCRIPRLQSVHAELIESRRFSADSGVGRLAAHINEIPTDTQAIWQLLRQDSVLNFEQVHTSQNLTDASIPNVQIKNSLSKNKHLKDISLKYENYISVTQEIPKLTRKNSVPTSVKETITNLMQIFNQFRVLTAGHNGEWGDHYINRYLTQWHLTQLKLPLGQNTWFHGRPIMVLQNNYELGLFNGDIGFCLQTDKSGGGLEVFFENKDQGIAVNLLNEELIATAYAMTIHKSQGSEFDHVAITFDNSHSRLLSKELIYTAVTRAKRQVTIYSTKSALQTALQTPTQRYTGLALQFSNLSDD